MNFEELNGRAPLNGDALPRVRGIMAYDSISPSDANFQKNSLVTTSAPLTVPDSTVANFIKFAITKILSETLTLIDLMSKTQLKKVDEPVTLADFNFSARVKSLAEAIALGDSRYSTQVKNVAEALTLVDASVKSLIRGSLVMILSESLTLTDTRFKTELTTISEAIVAGDFRSTKQLKKIVESLTVFEEFLKTVLSHGTTVKVVTENILVQVVQTIRKINILIVTKELTIYDQDRTFSYNVRCNEAFDLFTSFVAGINLKPPPIKIKVMEEDLKIFNSFVSRTYSRLVIDELLSMADDFPYWVMRFANLIDTVSLTDEIIFAKINTVKKILLTETLSLDATFILRKLKILTENLSVLDSGVQKTNLTMVSASVVTLDAFIKSALTGGQIFAKVSTEGLDLSDGTRQWVYRHKEFIETLAVPDSVSNKSRVLMQLLSEVTGLTDSIVKAFGPSLYLKIQTEGITLVDSTYSVKYAYRRLDEPLAVPDSQSHVTWSVRVPSESLIITDAITGAPRVISRLQAETLALTDATVAYALRQKILVETLALIDPATRQQIAGRIVSDSAVITDAQLHQSLRYQVASESVVLNDLQIAALAKLRTIAESITVQDGFTSVKINKRILMELLGITDEGLPTANLYVTLVVRNSIAADPSPVLGVDNLTLLGSDTSTTVN